MSGFPVSPSSNFRGRRVEARRAGMTMVLRSLSDRPPTECGSSRRGAKPEEQAVWTSMSRSSVSGGSYQFRGGQKSEVTGRFTPPTRRWRQRLPTPFDRKKKPPGCERYRTRGSQPGDRLGASLSHRVILDPAATGVSNQRRYGRFRGRKKKFTQ